MAYAAALTRPLQAVSPQLPAMDRIRGYFSQKELFNRKAVIMLSRAYAIGGRGRSLEL
jgi:hypothetical protein